MPLIDFRSDLTSLQYGSDRPGGGSSGQPYVQAPNPNNIVVPAPNSTLAFFDRFYNINRDTPDYPIRGGVITQIGAGGLFTTPAGTIDRARIQAFLKDGTRGRLFIEKQKGLQLSNPNIQVPSVIGPSSLGLGSELISQTRLYNDQGLNTLLQVEVQGTGAHITRHGLTPRVIDVFQQSYAYFVSRNNTESTNRLAILATLKIRNASTSGRSDANTRSFGQSATFAARYGVSPINSQILNYAGGPGSLYGVGFTILNRAVDTTQAAEAAVLYNSITMTYQQLATVSDRVSRARGSRKTNPAITDFRAQVVPATRQNPANLLIADYSGSTKWYNPATKGDPGKPERQNRLTYTAVNEDKIDKLNQQGVFYYDPTTNSPWDKDPTTNATKDIIKFAFECLDNSNINNAAAIVFRAYLTGLTDNHQAELSSFKYLGRGETFRTYQGADRSISFSFKIAAQSRSEMQPLYRKLNQLISQIYPDYTLDTSLMRGNVVRLTIGDYLYRVPGFLESLNISVADEYSWEINLEEAADMNQLPQVLDVQCSFKPIHNFLPRKVTQSTNAPFIGSMRLSGSVDLTTAWVSPPQA